MDGRTQLVGRYRLSLHARVLLAVVAVLVAAAVQAMRSHMGAASTPFVAGLCFMAAILLLMVWGGRRAGRVDLPVLDQHIRLALQDHR